MARWMHTHDLSLDSDHNSQLIDFWWKEVEHIQVLSTLPEEHFWWRLYPFSTTSNLFDRYGAK